MTFFAGSSCITISGGTFINNLPTRDAGQNRNSDGLMIVQDDDVDLHREIISGNGYRIYSASYGGRFAVVRTFEGPRAKQDWTDNMALCRKVFHPNVLKIVGVSEESSRNHFVLFRGITSEQKMQSLIAKALRIDLNTSVQLSMKAVKGIAAGLSYLKSQNTLVHAGGLNFNILTGYENEPIISFHPSTTTHDDGSVSQNFDLETGDRGIEVLNRICQQLFSGANSILYDDSPERNFDAYDREGLPTVNAEDTPNLSESEAISNPSSSTEQSKSGPTPRREVWWLDLGATDQSLESIKRRFEDCLNRVPISSSNSLLRRIISPKDNNLRWDLHQCRGYLREEITLTSDVSRSAIVSHAFPSQSELCSICGQLVQYATGSSVEPPQWLSGAMQAMRSKYPMDRFEVTLRKVNETNTSGPEWRIKCQDCPGKLYIPGPGETLSHYEVHLKNRLHRQHVNERLGNIIPTTPSSTPSSPFVLHLVV